MNSQQASRRSNSDFRKDLRSLMASTELHLPDTQLLGRRATRILRQVQLEHYARLAATPPELRPRQALQFLRQSIETDIRVTLLWRDLHRVQLKTYQEAHAPALYRSLLRLEKAESLPVLRAPELQTLRGSFSALRHQTGSLAQTFEEMIHNRYPEVARLLPQIPPEPFKRAFGRHLNELVWSLDHGNRLASGLSNLARQLHDLGFRREHYCAAAECLLNSLAHCAGKNWTPAVSQAWNQALELTILALDSNANSSGSVEAVA